MEDVKEKIRKIYRLAEEGIAGESEAAQKMLQVWLDKYGLSLEEVIRDEEDLFTIKYRNHWERKLIVQVAYKLGINEKLREWKDGRKGKEVVVLATPAEYVDLEAMSKFYMNGLEEDMNLLYRSFIHRQNLFPEGVTADVRDMTKEEREEVMRVLKMKQNLKKRQYNKQIEDKK